MRIHRKRLGLAVPLLALTSVVGLAQDWPAAPAPHEHGVGYVKLVLTDIDLVIDLTSAADDILGFEHWPRTEAEQAGLQQAATLLRDGAQIYLFPWDAGCRLGDVALERLPVTTSAAAPRQAPDGAGRDADPHDGEAEVRLAAWPAADAWGHARDPSRVGEGGAGVGSVPGGSGKALHSNIHALYRFTCVRPERLDQLDLALFDLFPRLRSVRVQYRTPQAQGDAELTPEQSLLRF
jgi:hypothetical protein